MLEVSKTVGVFETLVGTRPSSTIGHFTLSVDARWERCGAAKARGAASSVARTDVVCILASKERETTGKVRDVPEQAKPMGAYRSFISPRLHHAQFKTYISSRVYSRWYLTS